MKLIMLDRDGVINHDSDDYIKNEDEWQAIDGSLEAIAKLTQNEYQVLVISNQDGIGRQILSIDDLNRIHQKMITELAQYGGRISAIFFCPHSEDNECDCRKPKIALFEQIKERLKTPLEGVPYIGDKITDVQAAEAVNAIPVLVRTGYGKQTIKKHKISKKVVVFDDLATAVDALLETE